MNLFTKQKKSYGYRKQICGYQGVSGGGINLKTGIDMYMCTCVHMYTLLHIK